MPPWSVKSENRPSGSPLSRFRDLLHPRHGRAARLRTPGFMASEYGSNLRYGEAASSRSEEHTSELQSQSNIVCRLLLEKKNNISIYWHLATSSAENMSLCFAAGRSRRSHI